MIRCSRPIIALVVLFASLAAIAAGDYTGLAHALVTLVFWLTVAAVAFLAGAVMAVRERSWRPLLLPVLYTVVGFVLVALALSTKRLMPNSIAWLYVIGFGAPILAAPIACWWYRQIKLGH